MEQPQEVIEDEEHERAWDRVAAIDVAKASGVVCTRVPDEGRPGRRRARVWTAAATMGEVTALGDHLRCQGIEVVTTTSAGCGSSPGCGPSWWPSGPGTGPGWRSCWSAP
jgi:transposase